MNQYQTHNMSNTINQDDKTIGCFHKKVAPHGLIDVNISGDRIPYLFTTIIRLGYSPNMGWMYSVITKEGYTEVYIGHIDPKYLDMTYCHTLS